MYQRVRLPVKQCVCLFRCCVCCTGCLFARSAHFPVRSYEGGINQSKRLWFRPEIEWQDFGKVDAIGKSISKGAEWHKFQLRSTFQ